jgi:hypothetical protein
MDMMVAVKEGDLDAGMRAIQPTCDPQLRFLGPKKAEMCRENNDAIV